MVVKMSDMPIHGHAVPVKGLRAMTDILRLKERANRYAQAQDFVVAEEIGLPPDDVQRGVGRAER